jgi:hypothetical protein
VPLEELTTAELDDVLAEEDTAVEEAAALEETAAEAEEPVELTDAEPAALEIELAMAEEVDASELELVVTCPQLFNPKAKIPTERNKATFFIKLFISFLLPVFPLA